MFHELTVETDGVDKPVRFRLRDEHGQQVGASQLVFHEHRQALWEGLFDTRQYVLRYTGSMCREGQAEPATAGQLIEDLGVFLGQKVLGPEIFGCLARGGGRRTLLVRLPAAGTDPLAAAFARATWEIARDGADQPPLMERNLIVRAVTDDMPPGDDDAADVSAGGTLRVLMVYAEAPGSRPLAMRLERERLLELFHKEILPNHRVEIDVLCHGVTRSAIRERITATGGYHVLHWSGHGHLNLLELRGDDGSAEPISGQGLVDLLTDAGGFIPRLVFLSACLSGTVVRDWSSIEALLTGQRTDLPQKEIDGPRIEELLGQATGYTGTALELLKSGVPQVIAMRYSVGDDYARELARWFYKRLLADRAQPATDDALSLARGDLLRNKDHAGHYSAIDHATPLIFGRDGRLPRPAAGRSPQMDRLRPRPQPLLPGGSHELDLPGNFVGRSKELTLLSGRWLTEDGPAVALIQGLAGLGKTVLAAEGIQLWHGRFDWVLAFQAKPVPLTVDEFFRQVDAKLTINSSVYSQRCDQNANWRTYLKPGRPLSGGERCEQMRNNLLEALRDEAVLLVVDNFEPNLEDRETPGAQGYASADPQWDELLRMLARELPGTRSRLLVTSRHLPAAFASEPDALWIPLGPLSGGEMALYIPTHEKLARLFHAGDEGKALVRRLLETSRGHPLIMDRLAALADDHDTLTAALDEMDAKGGRALPELFTAGLSDEEARREREYLEDVAVGSVDLLIRRLTPDARRLLWVVTLANEPSHEELIEGVWSGGSVEDDQLRQLRQLLAMADQLPEEVRQRLANMPPEIREKVEQLTAPAVPPIGPLLEELHTAGLLTRLEDGGGVMYAFHELVRERTAEWMAAHASERAGRTEEGVWVAYGQRYVSAFAQLHMSGRERAREVSAEAGRRALVYMIRARAFDRLDSFASALVVSTSDPTLLRGVIAELEAVADQVPPGEDRWSVRTNLASALLQSGRPDEALGLYEQAVTEAEEAQDWSDVAWICGNWGQALRDIGRLDEARATQLRSADAHRRAGRPKVELVGSELETLRIDVYQGKAEEALPEIEKRLDEVRGWWQRHRAGQSVPEAPAPGFLGRALLAGLNIACEANLSLERWQACLNLLEETEQTKRESGESEHELAMTRFNRYGPLIRLGRLGEAQRVVERCLDVFREVDDLTYQARALGALANVWDARGDTEQAIAVGRQALAVCNRLPNPSDRSISHGNLSTYLDKARRRDESTRHQLASIVYCVVSGHRQKLSTRLRNLAIDIRRAAASGGRYELPKLAELLARPEFDALNHFLAQHQIDPQALQAQIDQLVEQARQTTES